MLSLTKSCLLRNTGANIQKEIQIAAGKDKNIKNSEKYGEKRYDVGAYSLIFASVFKIVQSNIYLKNEVEHQSVSLQGYGWVTRKVGRSSHGV